MLVELLSLTTNWWLLLIARQVTIAVDETGSAEHLARLLMANLTSVVGLAFSAGAVRHYALRTLSRLVLFFCLLSGVALTLTHDRVMLRNTRAGIVYSSTGSIEQIPQRRRRRRPLQINLEHLVSMK